MCELCQHVNADKQKNIDDVSTTQSWSGNMDSVIDALETVAEAGGLTLKKWTKMGDVDETKYLGYTWCPFGLKLASMIEELPLSKI